jgi:serine/threonine protein kinase
MSVQRIGDRRLGGPREGTVSEAPRLASRVGAALGSPVGVLIVVPGLVFAVGLLLTLIGQGAIARSSLALGGEQVQARNAMVARQIGLSLAQSDVLLARLRALAETRSSASAIEPLAFALRDLVDGRAGIAYASLCFPDGTFQGAYVDTDGSVRFQDSRVEVGYTRVRRFATDGRGELRLLREERSSYDPRQRDFYRLAVASPGRVWTKPYPFFKTHYTGITHTEAVREPGGALRAVLTVDFDVNELSRYLDKMQLDGGRVVLFSRDGVLFGDTAARLHTLPAPSDHPLAVRDVRDPVLDALVAATAGDDVSPALEVASERYLTHLTSVGPPELGWRVASLVPEELLLQPARAYQRRAALFAALALLVAAAVAVMFSRHIVRMRRQTIEARAAATRAAAEARELGSYRLVARLGAGGMGEVWRAEHRLLAREAAIKLIRSETAPTPEVQERFRREAQTLAALRSRNTIELFDYGVSDDGTFYYVMELLDGMDLETLVGRFGPQPPARVRAFLLQACSSLAEAHVAGMVHRDIKPANLFLCRAADEVDVLKVLDFGLVRSLEDGAPQSVRSLEDLERELGSAGQPLAKLTAAGSVVGTPEFMAPEQILGRETDGRTDIYALGCVAYFALSGELPFVSGKEAMAIMLSHLQSEPIQLATRMKAPLPDGFSELVMRCVAKRPEQRPPSMSALRAELQALDCEDAWTEEDATEWWARHVPRRPSVSLRPSSPARAVSA